MAGSTSSISYLSKGLSQKGHRVYVGGRKESLLFHMLQNTGVNLIPMTFNGKLDIINIRQIKNTVKKYSIDLINAQSSYDRYSSIFSKWIYKLNVKVVHTRRQIPRSIGGWLQNTFYLKGSDKIVAVSSEIKNALIKIGLLSDHIIVIPNGIPQEKYARVFDKRFIEKMKKDYGILPEDVVIGCVSRKKNQEQLLRALRFINIKTKVLFIGIEEHEIDQKLILQVKNTHNIIFCGRVNHESVLNYYKLFTLHVLPSTTEGISQTLLEAMAFGIPVIATRAAGNIDLIEEGYNGYLFEDNNIQELVVKIMKVIEKREFLGFLIANAKKTAIEKYSIANTINTYEKFFKQLISKN
ncbi:MAG: glycosyltransferase family 4 protein [bacterium]|nr:glycosyltransferase family 4 protein [bacterium]